MRYPAERMMVRIPDWVIASDLFQDSGAGSYFRGRVLQIAAPTEYQFTYTGPLLGPKHLLLWKALYTQAWRRWDGVSASEKCAIRVSKLLRLLGVEDRGPQAADEIGGLVADLKGAIVKRRHKNARRRGGFASINLLLNYLHVEYKSDNSRSFFVIRIGIGEGLLASEAAFADDAHSNDNEATVARREPAAATQNCNPGFVYIASNPSFPDLKKIGMTRLPSPDMRMTSLSQNVPTSYQLEDFVYTREPRKLELAIHKAFAEQHCSKEFFWVGTKQASVKLRDLQATMES